MGKVKRIGVEPFHLSEKQKTAFGCFLFFAVAGVGIEPTSGDYEPPDPPLVHPAEIFRFYPPHGRQVRKSRRNRK